MISAAKKQKSAYSPTATIVDGKLILSCPGALSPVVWQMDMAEAKASALEVFEDAQAKPPAYVLMLRTLKDDFVTIANFSTKEEAVATLMAVTKALQSAHGLIRPLNSHSQPHAVSTPSYEGKRGGGRWGLLLIGLLALGGLMVFFSSMKPGIPPVPDSSGNMEIGEGAEPQNGVPLSADEFLKNNR